MNDMGASRQRVRYRYHPRDRRWAVYRETTFYWPDGDEYTEGCKVADYATREEAKREARRLNEELQATSDE